MSAFATAGALTTHKIPDRDLARGIQDSRTERIGLAELQLHAETLLLIAVVVPLKPESHGAVRALLRRGPPFDPEQINGLERYEVLLTVEEAIFLFESRLGTGAIRPLLSESSLWQVAAAWRDHLAGPPRLAEEVYSWASGAESDELFYLPTPGPGDSDGGDIF